MIWTEATLPKTKAEVVVLLNALEANKATLTVQVEAQLTTINTQTMTIVTLTQERDTLTQEVATLGIALQAAEQWAEEADMERVDVERMLLVEQRSSAPMRASLDALEVWLTTLPADGVTIPIVESP